MLHEERQRYDRLLEAPRPQPPAEASRTVARTTPPAGALPATWQRILAYLREHHWAAAGAGRRAGAGAGGVGTVCTGTHGAGGITPAGGAGGVRLGRVESPVAHAADTGEAQNGDEQ
jgi:hypothetical protein